MALARKVVLGMRKTRITALLIMIFFALIALIFSRKEINEISVEKERKAQQHEDISKRLEKLRKEGPKKEKYFSVTRVSFIKEEEPEEIHMIFVGDILLARRPGYTMRDTGNINYPFEKVKEKLSSADLTFGNMEGCFTGNVVTGNVKGKNGTWYCFRSPAKFAQSLTYAGFDVVSLANNHSMNGGQKGILDTIQTLDELGVVHVGAGKNITEAEACKITTVKGLKIGFLARTSIGVEGKAGENTPGIAVLDENIFKAVSDCDKKSDILITTFHWGNEQEKTPNQSQKKYVYRLIDAGVDIIIGHHPHVLQPVEIYKGKVIAYSLGNFVFDNPKESWRTSMILEVFIDSKTKDQRVNKIPVMINNTRPEIISKSAK
uniref:CapA family protein n=1 Tax=candidate division CPR3 bacterium TaxID=2268181 RepID=A0A7C4R5T0_UNCC3